MILNEKTGLYENYGLWHVPLWQTQSFYLALKIIAAIAALAVLFFIYRLYSAYRKRKKISAWNAALRDLALLNNQHAMNVAQGKEFYLAVGSILKNYLYVRFGYDLVGKTDDEVIEYLRLTGSEQWLMDDICTVLQGSTVIKFANVQAAQEQMSRDYALAVEIVTRTIPKEKITK